MKKKPTISEVLEALQTLVEASPLTPPDDEPWDDDPWSEKTVDIRPDPEAGEAARVRSSPGLPPEAHEESSLVRMHDSRKWEQIYITTGNGFWVIEMGEKGPIVQSLRVSREGRPYELSNLDELLKFEQEFRLDRMPWPGNVIMSKKKVI